MNCYCGTGILPVQDGRDAHPTNLWKLFNSHSLELCFARLIQYYQDQSAADCQWLIDFLEVCQIALTIYGENVQYNLVNMSEKYQEEQLFIDLNNCRVFSQHKQIKKDKD